MKKETDIIHLQGKVTTGQEDGQYYLSKEEYKKQIRKKLGIEPYEGTLNIDLDKKSISRYQKIKSSDGIKIQGFKDDKGEYGGMKAFPATVQGIDGFLIIPEKTEYSKTAEIISSHYLREDLGLVDGDIISIKVSIG